MSILDIFSNDAFSTVEMTDAIDRVETVPQELGNRGIFVDNNVRTEKIAIEDRAGTLSLIQTSERGAPLTNKGADKRKIRDFRTGRIAKKATIHASELAFLRGFSQEAQIQAGQVEIARRLTGPNGLLAEIEMTWENMRLGAIQGIVKDADDSTIYNYFDEFNISAPAEINFELSTKDNGHLRKQIKSQVIRPMRRAAKGMVYSGIDAFCGDNFYDKLHTNPEVYKSYLNQQEASDLREEYAESFVFGGVRWINYQGTDDASTVAIETEKVRFVPRGASGAFEQINSPGETFSDIGTVGRPVYIAIEPEQRSDPRYVDIEVYSYPLFLARRPDTLLSGRSD